MRFLKFAVLAALFAVPVSSANAGVLNSLLSFDGFEDVLVDESRSSFFDNDQSGGLSKGDVIYGFLAFSDAERSTGPNSFDNISLTDQLVATFSFELTDIVADVNGAAVFVHGAVSAANTLLGQDIDSLLGAGLSSAGGAGASFVLVSHTGLNPEPLNYQGPTGVNPGPLGLKNFTSADWDYELTAGFAAGDFLHLEGVPSLDGKSGESGGLTILDSATTPVSSFLLVDATSLLDGTDSKHHFGLSGQVLLKVSANGWSFTDTTRVTLNAVPEPTSLLAFGLLIGVAGVRRRSRKSA